MTRGRDFFKYNFDEKYEKLKILPPGISLAFFMRIRLQEASYNADPCGFGSTLLHIGLGTVVTFSR